VLNKREPVSDIENRSGGESEKRLTPNGRLEKRTSQFRAGLSGDDRPITRIGLMPLLFGCGPLRDHSEFTDMAAFSWWKRTIIYQIYPRSFQDSNGDGVGDLAGIRQRLDHLTWLGVGAIWISPVFRSPMADFGYDISDYCAIDPTFGSIADFDLLIRDAHSRGLKVILDYVPNHTSDQHPWFVASRASQTGAKRDWYIWRDGKPGGRPPNNWISQFGGPAWTFDEMTGQYYLHSFLPQQPDLNWRNDAVRAAMFDVLRFWLDRGVDGFRVDVLWLLIKDTALRDNPPNPAYLPTQAGINRTLSLHNADQPEIHELIAQMRAVLDGYGERLLIGEIYLPFERLAAYYGEDLRGAHLPFNFALINARWDAATIGTLIREYESSLPVGGWPNWVIGNHDQPRIATRVGADQARIAAMLLLTLRGTPTMYYGDEIGMPRVDVSPEMAQDPWEKREPGLGLGRDPSRTPMQWDQTQNAGFTMGKPWLPLEKEFEARNIVGQASDLGSMLSLNRALILLRNEHDALNIGDQRIIDIRNNVLLFERSHASEAFLVALNFGQSSQQLPELIEYDTVLSTHLDHAVAGDGVLRANEGLIFKRR
jgi:alpha-glucosidase